MNGTLQLIAPITSKKSGVVFPRNVDLNFFVDDKGRIFAEHTATKKIYVRVKELNAHNVKYEKNIGD